MAAKKPAAAPVNPFANAPKTAAISKPKGSKKKERAQVEVGE